MRERSRSFFFAPWEWRQDKAEKSCLLHDSTRRSFGRHARLPAESSCVSIGMFVLATASVFVLLYACLCTNFVASRTPHQDCARQLASTSPAYVTIRQHASAFVSMRQHASPYVFRVNSLPHHHRSHGRAFAPADEHGQVRVTGHNLAHDNFLTTKQSSSRGRTPQIFECREGGVRAGGGGSRSGCVGGGGHAREGTRGGEGARDDAGCGGWCGRWARISCASPQVYAK